MFSRLFSDEFSKTIKTANKFGFPLTWNIKQRRLQFSREIHSKTNVVRGIMFLYTFYVVVQTIRQKSVENSTHFSFLLAFSYAMGAMSVGTYIFSNQPKEVERNLNALFLYTVRFYGMYAILLR